MFSLHHLNYEKNYYTHCTTKKHEKFYFRMKKPHKIFFAQKNNIKFYLHVGGAFDNYQLLDAEMQRFCCCCCCRKMWISQNMFWLLCSNRMSRLQCMKREEKATTFLSAGRKYGLRFMKKLCTHVQVLGVVALGKDERQGCNPSYCWQQPLVFSVNSKSPLICIAGKQRKDHKSRSLNYCFFANQRVLFFAMPFLPRLCAKGPFENCQVRMFVKQRALPSANVCEAAEQAAPAVTCCWK